MCNIQLTVRLINILIEGAGNIQTKFVPVLGAQVNNYMEHTQYKGTEWKEEQFVVSLALKILRVVVMCYTQ